MSLMNKIQELAEAYTQSVVAMIRSVPIEALLMAPAPAANPPAPSARSPRTARTPGPKSEAPEAQTPGRLSRRSPADIAVCYKRVATHLSASPGGLRSEELRMSLGFDKREMPRILREGVTAGVLKKRGAKRATRYFAK